MNIDITLPDYKYKYPKGLDLRPGSKQHSKLLDLLVKDIQRAKLRMQNRYSTFRQIDRVLNTYVSPDVTDQKLKQADARNPVTIVCPYSVAIMETTIAYLVAAFFQSPIFRYEGVSPEDTIGAIALEHLVNLHAVKNRIALNLHTMFRDAIGYGTGFVAPIWLRKKRRQTMHRKRSVVTDAGRFVESGKDIDVYGKEVIVEGNTLSNVSVYKILPDPDISVHEPQRGKFIGWEEEYTYMQLLEMERDSGESMFNVKYLKYMNQIKHSAYFYGREDIRGTDGYDSGREFYDRKYSTVPLYREIIPKEYELGDGEYPEKWQFMVTADAVIHQAKKMDLHHEEFPVVVAAPDFDGYSSTPLSRMESLQGMQTVLDFLFNMHLKNVRRAVNNVFMVDPGLVNIQDIIRPKTEGAYLIRMRRKFWGAGRVKEAFQQVPIADVTRQHIGDSHWVSSMMEKAAGVDSASMGNLRMGGPERLTSKEFVGTQQGMFTRLERLARIIGLQAMQPLGDFFAYHTKQFLTQENYLKITGRHQEELLREFEVNRRAREYSWNQRYNEQGRWKVTPFDLDIDHDVLTRDGSIPGGNFSNVWINMFEILASHPELQGELDIVRIFKHIARNSGAKNVSDFVKIKLQPDEQIIKETERGNLIGLRQ